MFQCKTCGFSAAILKMIVCLLSVDLFSQHCIYYCKIVYAMPVPFSIHVIRNFLFQTLIPFPPPATSEDCETRYQCHKSTILCIADMYLFWVCHKTNQVRKLFTTYHNNKKLEISLCVPSWLTLCQYST